MCRYPLRRFGIPIFLALIALVGSLLRILAMRGELWLDEVWSVMLLRDLNSPLDIFNLTHDNNHLINSLWLWMCGTTAAPWLLRLPAVIFACATIVYVGRLAASSGDRATRFFLVLCATSYPLVLYGSEARGYSLAVLCAVVAVGQIDVLLRAPSRKAALRFALICSIGCFSHAIFALFLGPVATWFIYRVVVHPAAPPRRSLTRLAILPPVIVGLALTALFYGRLNLGGAPVLPHTQVLLSAVSVAFGGEELSLYAVPASAWSAVGATLICTVALVEIVVLYRQGDQRAGLAFLLLIAPLCAIAATHPPFLLSRYFLLQILLLYLLVARFLARLAARGTLGYGLSWCIIVGYCVLNGRHIYQLIVNGRAHYIEAFTEIVKASGDRKVTVGGDWDFQNAMRLEYARSVAPQTSSLVYLPRFREALVAPRYVLRESIDRHEPMPLAFQIGEKAYELLKVYPTSIFSGSWWYLFRQKGPHDERPLLK